jgi:peptide/nickel transport system substrate-binding protein
MNARYSRQIGRRRFLASTAAAGAGAASLALVGCGDDDDDDAQPTSPTSETSTQPAAQTASASAMATAGPKRGGVTYQAWSVDTIGTLDPHRSLFANTHYLLAAAMSRLVEYGDPAGETLVGDLSDGLPEQPDPDGLTMVFKLREGIKWHNRPPVNGRPFDTHDVAFNIERQKAGLDRDGVEDPTFYRRGQLSVVERVEAVDARTVRFTLSRPDATLLDTLAGPFSFLVAREAAEAFSNDE